MLLFQQVQKYLLEKLTNLVKNHYKSVMIFFIRQQICFRILIKITQNRAKVQTENKRTVLRLVQTIFDHLIKFLMSRGLLFL